ncbi:hypothetical protein ACFE04_015774 [Oxalis oulophora]
MIFPRQKPSRNPNDDTRIAPPIGSSNDSGLDAAVGGDGAREFASVGCEKGAFVGSFKTNLVCGDNENRSHDDRIIAAAATSVASTVVVVTVVVCWTILLWTIGIVELGFSGRFCGGCGGGGGGAIVCGGGVNDVCIM